MCGNDVPEPGLMGNMKKLSTLMSSSHQSIRKDEQSSQEVNLRSPTESWLVEQRADGLSPTGESGSIKE